MDDTTLFLNSSNPVNNHSTVSFTLNKPATLTVYVTGPDFANNPVTLQATQLMPGGRSPGYSFPWSGNYPNANSAGKVNITSSSSATFKVAVVDPDNAAVTDTETLPITLGLLENSNTVTAGLNIQSPDGTSYQGLTVVHGDARFYYETQARGQKHDPIPVTIVVSASSQQNPVLWYPFVPYSFYLTRHYPSLRLQPYIRDYYQYGRSSGDTGFFGHFCNADARTTGEEHDATGFVTINENDWSSSLNAQLGTGSLNNQPDNCQGFAGSQGSVIGMFFVQHTFSVYPPLKSGENPSGAWDNFDLGHYETVESGFKFQQWAERKRQCGRDIPWHQLIHGSARQPCRASHFFRRL